MVIDLEIAFTHKNGKGPETHTRTWTLDLDDMPLILIEALEQEGIGQMRAGITEYLGLTEEESRQLRLKHVKQISEAIKQAQDIPNG